MHVGGKGIRYMIRLCQVHPYSVKSWRGYSIYCTSVSSLSALGTWEQYAIFAPRDQCITVSLYTTQDNHKMTRVVS